MRQPNGTTLDVALTIETVRDFQARAIALRWLLRDITARKQAEEKLRRLQLQNLELRELERLKSLFISTISHELHTPLSTLLEFAQRLHNQSHQWDNHLADMTERIIRNGKHLLTMIEALLSFSRLKSNRLILEIKPFDLSELFIEISQDLQPLIQQKELELKLALPEESFIVNNDPVRLRQVVVNLLSNAIKFTDTGTISLWWC